MGVTTMYKLSLIFLILLPAVLSLIGLFSGIWAIGSLTLAGACAMLAMHQFVKGESQIRSAGEERSRWRFVGTGSAVFVCAGLVLLAIRPHEWVVSVLAIGFFGLCLLVALRHLDEPSRL